MATFARQVAALGSDPVRVGAEIVEQLIGPQLQLAIVFAHWALDPAALATACAKLGVPVVGCTAHGTIGPRMPIDGTGAVAIGFYGDWLRVGIGVAPDLSTSPITRSRDAVIRAAAMLDLAPNALDPVRHVALTLANGYGGNEEAFCIGSAATAPHIRFLGGFASAGLGDTRAAVWINGEIVPDGGIVLLLESELPFQAVVSSHLLATATKTVVTGATGREIHELDGKPAVPRLHELVRQLGEELRTPQPTHAFARYLDGTPYVRSIHVIDDQRIQTASTVEPGHVLRIMRPGDLIATTQRDLASARERVGGELAAFLAFSCASRHWEAKIDNLERELAACYGELPTIGFATYGEQSGMLFVNHTLTGLAIGALR